MSAVQTPRGTFDILPDEAQQRAYVERVAQEVLESSGYRRIETPTLEATELFARTVGESSDIVRKEMFTLTDQGSRSLTLRPEGTASVARSYLQQGMFRLPQPVKLWYYSPFYRQETPQEGRYRQFWQIGAELLGVGGPLADAEGIMLLDRLLKRLNIDTELRLNSIGTAETRQAYRSELQSFLRARANLLSPDVQERIELNPLRAFDSKDEKTQKVMLEAPLLRDWLGEEEREYFNQLCSFLKTAGVQYRIDPTLVRGLDYYSQTVYEFTSDKLGAQNALGGGGRYDDLITQLGGQPTAAAGWAAGVERILRATEISVTESNIDLYIAYTDQSFQEEAFRTYQRLGEENVSVQLDLSGRRLRRQLAAADKCRARKVVIIGEKSVVKDMGDGSERAIEFPINISELLDIINGKS